MRRVIGIELDYPVQPLLVLVVLVIIFLFGLVKFVV
jgi:hypothetical protein